MTTMAGSIPRREATGSVRRDDPFGSAGKYRVLMELGQGGTAVVYLAVARGPAGFNKLVVLKVLKRNLVDDAAFRDMFLHEARLSARLNHPNIVQVNEVIEQDGLPIIVMQYLEGHALSDILTRAGNKLPLRMHLQILAEVLSGLHYSHELTDYDETPLGVVHRDMTPHNVFVTYDGQVRVLDFGIAKLGSSQAETQTGIIKGKLRYMPPEQIAGEAIDRRTDIYAVGVMLWEAATGSRMWHGVSEATVMNRVLRGEVPLPSSEKPGVDPELERIVMKALAYEKADRHASALELQAEIESYLGNHTPMVTSREIARFVSENFDEVRSATKRAVEEQLKADALRKDDSSVPVSFPPFSGSQSFTRAEFTSSSPRQGEKKRAKKALVWLGAGAILAAATAVAVVASRPEPNPAPAAPAPVAAPPEVKDVQVRITAFPATATVFVDGKPVAGNPYSETRPIDGQPHTIRAEAEGHIARSETVTFDADRDIVLVLQQAPKPEPEPEPEAKAKPPEPVKVPRVRRAPPPAPKPAPRPNCNPPYTVDSRGVKKFKPECI